MKRQAWEQELSFLHQNLSRYLEHWPSGQESWSPVEGKAFTLLELASHLYTLPLSYAAILRGADETEIIRLQGGPWEAKGARDLLELLDQGISSLRVQLGALSDAEFGAKPVPWPFGEPMSPEEHLLKLITHIYHHRGQFHMYLKQLGQPVDTDTIFAS